MRQEFYNSMMQQPGELERRLIAESKEREAAKLPLCPDCGEEYCGSGDKPCVECEPSEIKELNMPDWA